MAEAMQYLVTGLGVGLVYAIIGLGLVLIYQVTGVINFAQGEFVMAGGLTFALAAEAGWPLGAGLGAAILVAGLLGVLVEKLVIAPRRDMNPGRQVFLTLGAGIAIRGVALVLIGTNPHFAPPITSGPPVEFFGARLPQQYLWILLSAAVVSLGLWFFLNRTLLGVSMRAVAIDRMASRIVGVSPGRMSLLAFALGGMLAGLAGSVLAPLQSPDSMMGLHLGLYGFAAAAIGGLGSTVGAAVGGLVLGVVSSVAVGFLPSGYQNAVAFGLLAIILLVRPSGLLGWKAVTRV
ncbi:branched-chain amino acid ABC transporter permease [Pseudonocardia hispaniensis]|uniref:Branched-chain amino acid ABC transporter permease n=1 Tax=Pseudonocardia hispaniensis TaxID=904933 RepID=A0ABW1IZ68_9PSEU